MKTVYGISSGEYSDYSVSYIVEDKEVAELVLEILKAEEDNTWYNNYIEEFDMIEADDVAINVTQGWVRLNAVTGDVVSDWQCKNARFLDSELEPVVTVHEDKAHVTINVTANTLEYPVIIAGAVAAVKSLKGFS